MPFQVHELERRHAFVRLRPRLLPVLERDVTTRHDRLLQQPERRLLARQVLVVVAFDQQRRLHARIEDVAQELLGE